MYIARIRIENYKSYLKSSEFTFEPGINVIIGPNNSGKTALLEALSLRFGDKPHNTIETRVDPRTVQTNDKSRVYLTVAVDDQEELERIYESHPTVKIAAPRDGHMDNAISQFNAAMHNGLRIHATIKSSGPDINSTDLGLYRPLARGSNNSVIELTRESNRAYRLQDHLAGTDYNQTIGGILLKQFWERVYRFQAERANVWMCPTDTTLDLSQDGANLPSVLHFLETTNPHAYRELVESVTEIFPDVRWISSIPRDRESLEIKVWTIDTSTKRPDLAISLGESGTGIGQALAILYVVVSYDEPRTVIIDEPQSFLHPGAVKRLMMILKRFSQHEYLISTHSPEILRTANPATITSLHLDKGVTASGSMAMGETDKLQEVFKAIGLSPGDVLFPDSLVWVEGPTEANAFPLIAQHFGDRSRLAGIRFLPVIDADSLRGKRHAKKHARLVFRIYRELSGASAGVVPTLGMILDREGKSDVEIEDLRRISDGMVQFIDRRLYENYLLDADAIAHAFNKKARLNDSECSITAEKVSEWLTNAINHAEYPSGDFTTKEAWMIHAHGAQMLEAMFGGFSNNEISFQKPSDSVELTVWLLANRPQPLKEIWDLVRIALERK